MNISKMTEKRAKTATPHVPPGGVTQQQVEHEDAIGDVEEDGERVMVSCWFRAGFEKEPPAKFGISETEQACYPPVRMNG
jgi:hypothetical protein